MEEVFHVLLIDDDSSIQGSIESILSDEPSIRLEYCSSALEAISIIKQSPRKYAIVLVDYKMPEMNGAELNKQLLSINSDLLIVMHSGDVSRDALKESFLSGATDFIEKGLSAEQFRTKITSFCQKYSEMLHTLDEVLSPSESEELVNSIKMAGQSPEMVHVAKLVKKAAQIENVVLITGESGTGKELIARAIHENSSRSAFKFIPVNLGAIPKDLFESQMFGHTKGSFTGATTDNLGFFKAANKGTIFLDEIGDLALDMQVKLLRVLQEKEIQAVGSAKTEKVDVRVVAATNVDLDKAVKEGRFREDLFYRIHVLEIKIPALRERPEDIRSLIHHFKRKYNARNKSILMEVVRKFEKYKWPGNIRELEAEMQKLLQIIPDEKITLKHLDSKFFEPKNENLTELTKFTYDEFKDHLKSLERDYATAQFKRFKSKREAAREGFKVSESTLRTRMSSLKIAWEEK